MSVLIDIKLLKTRNEIAHGNYSAFDREEYIELHREVIGMLDMFRTQIENAARKNLGRIHLRERCCWRSIAKLYKLT
ncbi:MAG: hypothetical protein HC849_18575, partial [Oscillatoriales cyanobacterium RU_3_3]|nr:hypothetical protein [Oscillatoriales cyanobacterium RU_3_3]